MRWDIWFRLRGPAGHTVEAPNSTNPVECATLAALLAQLATNLPGTQFGVEVVGVRVERAPGEAA